MIEVYERVAKWNAARYDRIYNHELSCKILYEEIQEFFEAECSQVDELDALCDIVYVCFGIIWKFNADDHVLQQAETDAAELVDKLLAIPEILPVFHISAMFQVLQYDIDMPVPQAALAIIMLAMTQMDVYGLRTMEQKLRAVNIVCDSNDTKSIVKAKPDEKANAGNKGAYFTAPEPRLQGLLNEVQNVIH